MKKGDLFFRFSLYSSLGPTSIYLAMSVGESEKYVRYMRPSSNYDVISTIDLKKVLV